jgi:Cu(I)/Ag(I) efflux system membrane fusion protein
VGTTQFSLSDYKHGIPCGDADEQGYEMKTRILIAALVAAGLLGTGGYGLYRLGMHQGMQAAAGSAQPAGVQGGDKVDPATGRKVLYWHDPMVPGPKFDKPGKSPFMDMQLVPVYADEAADDGKVSISPRVQQNLGIRTAEVTKGSLSAPLEAVGSVAYNERALALVQARSNGFLERLHARAPLDPVKKGQPLAELYVPDWVAAQEEFLSIQRMGNVAGTEGLLDAARQRMRLAGMTDDQIRRFEASGRVQPRSTIVAPVSGVIAELGAREGMAVMTGTPLFRINGLSTVWVHAEVPENLAARVRPGNAVEGRTPALPGMVFKGKVGAILPEVNPATRTLKARIELDNPSGQLVPGMFVTVNMSPAARKDVLLAPSEAVIQTGKRSVVMVALDDGKFQPVEVETGIEANGQTEIRKGLDAGQKVVVSGQFLIDSEASLKGTITRMSDMPAGGKETAPTHHGSGKVEMIDKEEITLSHGPIPSLQWGPRTMGFRLPPTGLPKNIAVGDNVVFDIRQTRDGMFEIVSISPTAEAPGGMKADKPGASK